MRTIICVCIILMFTTSEGRRKSNSIENDYYNYNDAYSNTEINSDEQYPDDNIYDQTDQRSTKGNGIAENTDGKNQNPNSRKQGRTRIDGVGRRDYSEETGSDSGSRETYITEDNLSDGINSQAKSAKLGFKKNVIKFSDQPIGNKQGNNKQNGKSYDDDNASMKKINEGNDISTLNDNYEDYQYDGNESNIISASENASPKVYRKNSKSKNSNSLNNKERFVNLTDNINPNGNFSRNSNNSNNLHKAGNNEEHRNAEGISKNADASNTISNSVQVDDSSELNCTCNATSEDEGPKTNETVQLEENLGFQKGSNENGNIINTTITENSNLIGQEHGFESKKVNKTNEGSGNKSIDFQLEGRMLNPNNNDETSEELDSIKNHFNKTGILSVENSDMAPNSTESSNPNVNKTDLQERTSEKSTVTDTKEQGPTTEIKLMGRTLNVEEPEVHVEDHFRNVSSKSSDGGISNMSNIPTDSQNSQNVSVSAISFPRNSNNSTMDPIVKQITQNISSIISTNKNNETTANGPIPGNDGHNLQNFTQLGLNKSNDGHYGLFAVKSKNNNARIVKTGQNGLTFANSGQNGSLSGTSNQNRAVNSNNTKNNSIDGNRIQNGSKIAYIEPNPSNATDIVKKMENITIINPHSKKHGSKETHLTKHTTRKHKNKHKSKHHRKNLTISKTKMRGRALSKSCLFCKTKKPSKENHHSL